MDRIDATAVVEDGAQIGSATTLWQYAHVRAGARIGSECTVGRGVYVGPGAVVGDRCKLQNYALVYEPAVLEDGAFVGPGAVLTNDLNPRAVNPDGTPKSAADWDAVGVWVGRGAAIGARAVCVAPVRIGAWATVAAGAVVVRDVPDYALVAGVPARRIGWVGEAGHRLKEDTAEAGTAWVCPATGTRYTEDAGRLRRAEA
ncbi:acetylglucosamine-1-phosphate uridylyltransferase [Sinomonas atrocyanea]|uniref:Acetylglucosamine-1-phosphate uridylyltransferase n=1 Tax=Sinomonas atrocyanea TaxID=37927 RepID=A0A126ZZY8_9MICC|nr:acyltransferase [Sinomonas atrocyanea]AMM32171.1 acetylglucosamine-1-phosphate uridylyltransferase [Sinomonas atrocyanea]GEB64771.1 acetylglucosamine-1-phosphate uridylyltransferase [Sinomonas atrocyanea]